MKRVILVLIAVLLLAGNVQAGKKLIEWGWDQMSTRQFARDLEHLKTLPFDGYILDIQGTDVPTGINKSLFRVTNENTKWNKNWLNKEIALLQSIKAKHSYELFFNMHSNQGNVDWFDDVAIYKVK